MKKTLKLRNESINSIYKRSITRFKKTNKRKSVKYVLKIHKKRVDNYIDFFKKVYHYRY